jgi:hypothetical protein
MKTILEIFFVVVYNLTLIAGTAWLVQYCNWSPFWFILTVLLLATHKSDKEKE